jgi:hypothetical protein
MLYVSAIHLFAACSSFRVFTPQVVDLCEASSPVLYAAEVLRFNSLGVWMFEFSFLERGSHFLQEVVRFHNLPNALVSKGAVMCYTGAALSTFFITSHLFSASPS